MAATSSTTRRVASLTKQVANQIWTRDPVHHATRSFASSLSLRRSVHDAVYDKNVEDQVQSAAVPDEMIQPPSDKYWGPNPQTGVFGPASGDHIPAGERGPITSAGTNDGSVLEQKAFFRPLEDLDKPQHA